MLGTIALVAATALAAAPTPTPVAQTLAANAVAADFVRFCGDPAGDMTKALPIADGDGWTKSKRPLPTPRATPLSQGLAPPQIVDQRVQLTSAGALVLVFMSGKTPDGVLNTCSVGGRSSADFADLREAVGHWVNGKPYSQTTGGMLKMASYALRFPDRVVLDQAPFAKDADPNIADISLSVIQGNVAVMYSRFLAAPSAAH